ncbi:MAG: DUF5615 family PIN-like protein [Candidatus Aenigmarchaeota archaeon]|nr:DUF5615 family PIN-like protein [Candidatus Aenigmarchaeota archaeon]
MKTKFLADEHIFLSSVEHLKVLGVDIRSVQEADLRAKSDREVLQAAASDGRVLVTNDSDFLNIAEEIQHAGIIFLTRPMNTGELIREIHKISLIYSAEDLKNGIIYMS